MIVESISPKWSAIPYLEFLFKKKLTFWKRFVLKIISLNLIIILYLPMQAPSLFVTICSWICTGIQIMNQMCSSSWSCMQVSTTNGIMLVWIYQSLRNLPCKGTRKVFAFSSHWACIAIWLAFGTEYLHDTQCTHIGLPIWTIDLNIHVLSK